MSKQTISGIVVDGDSIPVANVVVEVQFSYGASQVTGPGVPAMTDDNGAFSVEVINEADGLDTCAVTIFGQIVNTFELDPEEASIDLGTITVEGTASSRPRLVAVPVDTVPVDPKTGAALIDATDTVYLRQSNVRVSGATEEGINAIYTHRGTNDGKLFYNKDGEATSTANSAIIWDGAGEWHLTDDHGDVKYKSLDTPDFPWDNTTWADLDVGDVHPNVVESPTAVKATVSDLATAIDAILNP